MFDFLALFSGVPLFFMVSCFITDSYLNTQREYKILLANLESNYKKIVKNADDIRFENLLLFSKENWNILISANCKKVNFIVENHIHSQKK